MSRTPRYVLSAIVVAVFGLAGCSSSEPTNIVPIVTASASPVSAEEPTVMDSKQHAIDSREELIEQGYVPSAPADYVTISGEVVTAVRWVEWREVDFIDFLLDSNGLPFVMTDGVIRCEFNRLMPETILHIQGFWPYVKGSVAPGQIDEHKVTNAINQSFTLTCTTAY